VTNATQVGTVETGIEGLNEMPFGSLVLVASSNREWRDRALVDAAIWAGVSGSVAFMALSELPGLTEIRCAARKEALAERWATEEASDTCGAEPQDGSRALDIQFLLERRQGMTKEERGAAVKAAHAKYESEHADWRAKFGQTRLSALAKLQADTRAMSIAFKSVVSPTLENLVQALHDLQPFTTVVVDDLAAIRKRAGQHGSAKLCGEYARALKDTALERKVLLIAGMTTAELKEKRSGKGRCLTLDDFGAYGSPELSADAVITSKSVWTAKGWSHDEIVLDSRY